MELKYSLLENYAFSTFKKRCNMIKIVAILYIYIYMIKAIKIL
jgi:hypothetical protein